MIEEIRAGSPRRRPRGRPGPRRRARRGGAALRRGRAHLGALPRRRRRRAGDPRGVPRSSPRGRRRSRTSPKAGPSCASGARAADPGPRRDGRRSAWCMAVARREAPRAPGGWLTAPCARRTPLRPRTPCAHPRRPAPVQGALPGTVGEVDDGSLSPGGVEGEAGRRGAPVEPREGPVRGAEGRRTPCAPLCPHALRGGPRRGQAPDGPTFDLPPEAQTGKGLPEPGRSGRTVLQGGDRAPRQRRPDGHGGGPDRVVRGGTKAALPALSRVRPGVAREPRPRDVRQAPPRRGVTSSPGHAITAPRVDPPAVPLPTPRRGRVRHPVASPPHAARVPSGSSPGPLRARVRHAGRPDAHRPRGVYVLASHLAARGARDGPFSVGVQALIRREILGTKRPDGTPPNVVFDWAVRCVPVARART